VRGATTVPRGLRHACGAGVERTAAPGVTSSRSRMPGTARWPA